MGLVSFMTPPTLPQGMYRLPATLLVIGLCVCRLVAICPEECACYTGDSGPTVNCRYQDFSEIPADTPQDTVELDMGHNNLATITMDTFPSLPALKKLKLDWCQIESLGNNAFSKLPNLEQLQLSNNRLSQLHEDSFTGIHKLKILHLDYNQIEQIPRHVFRELALDELLLHSNNLESLADSAFEGSSIVNLNLDENNISNISIELFTPLKSSLKNLNLSHNAQPLTMEEHVFSGFNFSDLRISYDGLKDASFLKHVKAQSLDISGHPFSKLDFRDWDNLRTTQEFYLRNLSITKLNESILANLVSLILLDLSQNELGMLDGAVFRFTPNLRVLRLDHNRFISLPEDLGLHLTQLEVLKVPWNRLAVVRTDAFQGLQSLRELDLRNNLIQVMDETMRPVLGALESVMLGGNPVHCNCEMTWYRTWLEESKKDTGANDCHSPMYGYIYNIPAESFVCRAPTVVHITPNMNAHESSDVFLTCRAEGDPAPEVQWSSPIGETVSVTPPFNRTKYATTAIWHMSRIQVKEGGWFICRASNRQGVTERGMYIHVVPPNGSFIDVELLTRSTPPTTTAETTATTTVTLPPTTTAVTTNPSTSEATTETITSPRKLMTSVTAEVTNSSQSETMTSPHIPRETSSLIDGNNEKQVIESFEPWKVAAIVGCLLGAILLFSAIGIFVHSRRKKKHKDIRSAM